MVRRRVRLHALHCPAALAGAVSLLLWAVLVRSSQRDMSKTSAFALFCVAGSAYYASFCSPGQAELAACKTLAHNPNRLSRWHPSSPPPCVVGYASLFDPGRLQLCRVLRACVCACLGFIDCLGPHAEVEDEAVAGRHAARAAREDADEARLLASSSAPAGPRPRAQRAVLEFAKPRDECRARGQDQSQMSPSLMVGLPVEP